jgi:predicted PurR-regulated permease PerM
VAYHSSSQLNNWTFRQIMWATLVLVSVVLSFWLLWRFYQVVFIMFLAMLMGTVIRPAVGWLQRRGLSRLAGGILVYLVLLALLVSFLLLLFPLIIAQGTTIAAAVPDTYQTVRLWMVDHSSQLMVRLSAFLPEALPGLQPLQPTGEQVLDTAEQALGYLGSAARVVFTATAILLLAFHWMLNGPRTIQSWLLLVPKGRREGASDLVAAIETKVGAYLAGQGVLCLAVGLLALAAYLLIGLPNALALALIAGVLEAVPMIGPLLGAIPAAIIALSVGPSKLVWVVLATIVIQQAESIVLVPRVMRKAVGVNPFVSLLALFAFGSLFGVAGALMAIPIAAILQLLLNRFVFGSEAAGTEVPGGRDYASRLRYEAQELAQDLRKQARLNKAGSDQRIKQIDQVMDEIEGIATDLDALLTRDRGSGTP